MGGDKYGVPVWSALQNRRYAPIQSSHRGSTLVRLKSPEGGAVEVRSCAVKNRAASNRNSAAVLRGGEQRNENDQPVTQVVQEDRRSELDSVGVDGRVLR